MADRQLTIKFIGQDAGLTQTANQASKATDKLGESSQQASAKATEAAQKIGQQYKLTEEQINSLAKRLDNIDFTIDKEGRLREASGRFVKIKDEIEAVGGIAKKSEDNITALGIAIQTKLVDVGIEALQSLGTAISQTLGAALSENAQFEQGQAAAATLVDNVDELTAQLAIQQKQLGGQVSTNELLAASYDVLSSGFTNAAEAAEITGASARGAIAGFSDVGTVSDAVTTILNSYADANLNASQVVDQLVKTQDLGKITVDQYAQSIGRAASIASTAGVGFDELNAAVAAATTAGVAPESAISGIRQAIVNLLRPTEDAKVALKEFLGTEDSAGLLQAEGLEGVLNRISAQDLSTQDLSRIFTDVDALAAIAPIAGANIDRFNEALRGIGDASGAAQANFEKLSDTIPGLQKQFQTNLREGLLATGQALAPLQAGVLEFINALASASAANFDGFDELADAGNRLRDVLTGNPELIEALGEAIGRLANEAVDQFAGIIDAFTAFLGEADNVDGAVKIIGELEATLKQTGQTVRFLIALAESLGELNARIKDVPVLGDAINAAFGAALNTISGGIGIVRSLGDTFNFLRDSITSAGEFVQALVQRFGVLADNPVIQALISQIGEVEAGFESLESSGGIKGSADALQAGSEALGTAVQNLKGTVEEGVGDPEPPDVSGVVSEYQKTADAAELSTQQQKAALIEQGATQEEIAEVERQALSERIASQQQFLAELKAIDQAALDPEAREELQNEILQTEKQIASDRIQLAQDTEQARLDAIEKAADDAIALTTETEQQRQIELATLRRDGLISEEEYQAELGNATQERIRGELEAEKQKLADLEAAEGDFSEEIRDSKQQINELTLSLIEEEIAAEERARDIAIAAIEEQALLQQTAADAQVQAIERVANAFEVANGAIERRSQLLEAQQGLINAQEDALQNAFDVAISLTEDENQRAALEQQAAQARVAAIERAAAIEERILLLQIEQQKIQNQIEQSRAQAAIAQQQAETSQLQADLELLRQDPNATAGQIAAAEQAIAASNDATAALGQQLVGLQQAGALIQQTGALSLQTLRQQQGSESLSARAELARLTSGGSDDAAIRREALGIIPALTDSISTSFEQALRGTAPSLPQALTPSLPGGNITPQTVQQLLAQQQGAPAINQTNDVVINVTGADVANGNVATNLEEQVFSALDRVIQRASRQGQ